MNKLLVTICAGTTIGLSMAAELNGDNGAFEAAKEVQAVSVHTDSAATTAKGKVVANLNEKFGTNVWRTVGVNGYKIEVVEMTHQMENPTTFEEFFIVRELLVKRALMQAKVKLAEGMSATAEGEDSLDVAPGDVITTKFTSALKMCTEHPQTIFGATIINQAESYADGVYRVAVAVAYTDALVKRAVEMLAPTKKAVSPSAEDSKYIAEWLSKGDFSTMSGPRQIIAPSGDCYYIGIASREVGTNAEVRENNIRLAQMYAVQSMLFSLYADVTFCDAATAVLTSKTAGGVNGMTQSLAIETLERHISTKSKKVMRGLSEVYDVELVHPISGRTMYVSVYAMSASKAAAAKVFATEMAAFRKRVAIADGADRAYDRGLSESITDAAACKAAEDKAQNEAKQAVDAIVKPAAGLPCADESSKSGSDAAGQKRPGERKAKEGVFGGNEVIDMSIL